MGAAGKGSAPRGTQVRDTQRCHGVRNGRDVGRRRQIIRLQCLGRWPETPPFPFPSEGVVRILRMRLMREKPNGRRDPLGAPHLTSEWAFVDDGSPGLAARAREGAKGVAVGCFGPACERASLARLSESSCCTPALGFPNPVLGVSQSKERATQCPGARLLGIGRRQEGTAARRAMWFAQLSE